MQTDRSIFVRLCHLIEAIIAVFVVLAIGRGLIFLLPTLFQAGEGDAITQLYDFLEQAIVFVIATEFLLMLCRPSSENILDTIIFLIARHMIVHHNIPAIDYLLLAICIISLCLARRYLAFTRSKRQRQELEERLRIRALEAALAERQTTEEEA